MFYAGVGSRRTPKKIREVMTEIARALEQNDFTLRSGGDTAFEDGVVDDKIIYTITDVTDEALMLVDEYHPAPSALTDYGRLLIARNGFQILGQDLDTPCEFVLCWTPDGAETSTTINTGGTGQAIRIANAYNIPVFNLKNKRSVDRFVDYLLQSFGIELEL